tara:strand:- start:1425 stop:2201 length:777 start_codon:yes stop_codon:yes gene_type:complete
MNWSLQMLPTAEVDVPYPEVYWMERFQDWTTLQFQMGILRSGDYTVLVNTGFPEEISGIKQAWQEYLGDRAILKRSDNWKTESHLERLGIHPDEITHVIITPIQIYATGNLHLFKNAKICFSRKGWTEDVIAPTYPHHVPRQGCISDEHLAWLLFENESNCLLMEDNHELLPGLTCRWVGVHHRSSIAVEANTQNGTAILSDCAFHYANVEESRPLGIAESIIEAHSAYDYLRKQAKPFIPLYDPLVQKRFKGGIVAI